VRLTSTLNKRKEKKMKCITAYWRFIKGNGRVLSAGFALCLSLLLYMIFEVHAKGESRYKVSSESVISDSKTGLEWLVGPIQPTSYNKAKAWVIDCKIAGGGWRLPTWEELSGIYSPGNGRYNLDPVFNVSTTGSMKSPDGREVGMLFVWAESPDSGVLRNFFFSNGSEVAWNMRDLGIDGSLAFGVRQSSLK